MHPYESVFPMQANSVHTLMMVSYDLSMVTMILQFCMGLLHKIRSR